MTDALRALFVNSGLLGHRPVATPPISICSGGAANSTAVLRWPDATGDHRWRLVPDLLHFHTQATACCSLALMRRLPSIVSIDCTRTLARDEMDGPLARASYAPNARRDAGIFQAGARGRRHVRVGGLGPEAAPIRGGRPGRSHGVPRADACRVRRMDRGSARTRITGEPVRFLFVGGDLPRKGGWALLDAWRESWPTPAARLDIVTDWLLSAARLPRGARVHRAIVPSSDEWHALWRADAMLRHRLGAAAHARPQEWWDPPRDGRTLGDLIARCAAREAVLA